MHTDTCKAEIPKDTIANLVRFLRVQEVYLNTAPNENKGPKHGNPVSIYCTHAHKHTHTSTQAHAHRTQAHAHKHMCKITYKQANEHEQSRARSTLA